MYTYNLKGTDSLAGQFNPVSFYFTVRVFTTKLLELRLTPCWTKIDLQLIDFYDIINHLTPLINDQSISKTFVCYGMDVWDKRLLIRSS